MNRCTTRLLRAHETLVRPCGVFMSCFTPHLATHTHTTAKGDLPALWLEGTLKVETNRVFDILKCDLCMKTTHITCV